MTSFADQFDRAWVTGLADAAEEHLDAFPKQRFLEALLPAILDQPLKQRVNAIADALWEALDRPLDEATPALAHLAGPPGDPNEPGQARFTSWPMLTVVERHGLDTPEIALDALDALTRRFSAEFAIRPYLLHHPDLTWSRVRSWARSGSGHLRRLASEGPRPRLPWGLRVPALLEDPEPALEVLEILRHDPLANVRNSVSNHLNDISKDHPDRVIEVGRRWLADEDANIERVVRHGLRTLLKQGHPAALDVVGAPPDVACTVASTAPGTVPWGGSLRVPIAVTLTSSRPTDVVVDVRVHFPSARGERTKVFRGRHKALKPGQTLSFTWSLAMVPRSTRPLLPGPHRVVIQVNGTDRATHVVELLPA